MAGEAKLKLLRSILLGLGLGRAAVDDIVDWIIELLSPGETFASKIDFGAYRLREKLLSRGEHDFYLTLKAAAGESAIICPKVGLGDIFYTNMGDYAKNLAAMNRIDRKHVDFLLCDPLTMRALIAIELDDKSHQRKDRKERDRLVNRVFKAVGLPLQRIRVRRTYDVDALSELLGTVSTPADSPGFESTLDEERQVRESQPPACPRCGAEMVLRTAKHGKNKGEHFWGCPEFPRCRGVRKLE